jgi:hypothetical protein
MLESLPRVFLDRKRRAPPLKPATDPSTPGRHRPAFDCPCQSRSRSLGTDKEPLAGDRQESLIHRGAEDGAGLWVPL